MKPKRQIKTKPKPTTKRPGHPRLSAGEPSVRLNGIAPASLRDYAALIGGGQVSAGLRLALEFHRDNAGPEMVAFVAAFDAWYTTEFRDEEEINMLRRMADARRAVKL